MTSSQICGRLSYRDALAVGEVRALLASRLLSTGGLSVGAVALTVLVFRRTGSPLLSSLTFTLTFLPNLLTAGVLAGFVDRIRPRALSSASLAGSALVSGSLALPSLPLGVLFALLTLSATLFALSGGSTGRLMRDAVDERGYVPARSLARIASQVAQLAGNGLGGALVALLGPPAAIVAGAGLVAVASIVVRVAVTERPVPARTRDAPGGHDARAGRHPTTGIRAVLAIPELRRLLALACLGPLFAVAPEAVPAAYVAGHHAGAGDVGIWLLALPAGLIAGDVAGVRLLTAERQRRLLAPASAAAFAPYLAFAASPSVAAAIGLLVVSGGCGFAALGLDARLRAATPEPLFGQIMTLSSGAVMTTQALGFLLAGALAQLTSPGLAVAIAGGCGLVVVAATVGRERPADPVTAALAPPARRGARRSPRRP